MIYSETYKNIISLFSVFYTQLYEQYENTQYIIQISYLQMYIINW